MPLEVHSTWKYKEHLHPESTSSHHIIQQVLIHIYEIIQFTSYEILIIDFDDLGIFKYNEVAGWGFVSVGIGFFAIAWVFNALKGRV